MTTARTAHAQRRIARLASCLPVHRAFHWLHLHQPQLRHWQLEMLAIPAPTFDERARAAWFLDRFNALGLTNVHLDEAGNTLGELSSDPCSLVPGPCLLVSGPCTSGISPARTASPPVPRQYR
jgi:hypothetical protein